MKKFIYIIICVILILSTIISFIYLRKNEKEDSIQEEIFNELENTINEQEIKEENDIEIKEKEMNLQNLYEQNNDFVGWLKINDTNISYPVMQTDETRKDYYLKKNFYKEYSYMGTPYIAEYCNILQSDNLIIYGHHINNQKMFGELEKYKNKNFYNEHKIIQFNTINEKEDYEIIAVFKTIAYTGFNYYKFYNFSSDGEYDTFIKKCKELSFYDTDKTANYGEKLITLSTCEYSSQNGRLVIVAKKL